MMSEIVSRSIKKASLNSCIPSIVDGFFFLLKAEDWVDMLKEESLRLDEAEELGMSSRVEDDDAPGVDVGAIVP